MTPNGMWKEVETARGNMVKMVLLDDVKEDADISDMCV
jgi:hypothetical protein